MSGEPPPVPAWLSEDDRGRLHALRNEALLAGREVEDLQRLVRAAQARARTARRRYDNALAEVDGQLTIDDALGGNP